MRSNQPAADARAVIIDDGQSQRAGRDRVGLRAASAIGLVAAMAGLSACGDDKPTPPPLTFAERCAGLQGTTVASGDISLPTSGATIGSSAMVAATETVPEYCKVLGAIQPVDKTAPPINFELNLPSNWNQKAVHFGGGGLNGTLITGLGNVPGTANAGTPITTPLARGYATFGSDSGHSSTNPLSGAFAQNEESFVNFKGAQLRKTLDAAQFLIKTVYGILPQRQYFAGGSQGGNEAFKVAQRWPEKYDGIIAYFPALGQAAAGSASVLSLQTIFNTPGGWLNSAKQALIATRIMATCDPLDGLSDNLISNPNACRAAFNFSTLRCASGTDEGNGCLSDTQLQVVTSLASRKTLPFTLLGNVTSAPPKPYTLGGNASVAFLNSPTYDPTGINGAVEDLVKFFITKDPSASALTHNLAAFTSQWVDYSTAMDTTNPDMAKFRDRGGKIIWVHGYADSSFFFEASADYFNSLTNFLGSSTLGSFVRFYGVPGYDHGFGAFTVSLDSLSVLENWVEKGTAPAVDSLVVTDASAATRGRTRPLCEYPRFPRYKGSGDVNVASSFTCSAS